MRRWVTTLSITLGLGAAVAAPAVAQIKSVGLLAGATFAKLGGSDVPDGIENKVGFMGGGFVDIGLGGIISVRPEVAYVQKGAKQSDAGDELKLKLDYIEVPVLLVVSVPTGGGMVKPEFFAGPAIAFKASCKFTGTSGGQSATANCDDPGVDSPIKSTDFGVMFGAGVAVRNFMASVRYDLGLTKIDDSTDPGNIKNRAFMILVGWAFPLIHM